MKKIGLLPKLIIAIVLGILLGSFLPDWAVRVLTTYNYIFAQFINFAVPLIIVAFVAPGIADLGDGAGKTLAITAGIAYVSTLIAGSLAYGANALLLPKILDPASLTNFSASTAEGLKTYFEVNIPPIFGVMTALILAFLLGIGMAAVNSKSMKSVADEFQAIIASVIKNFIIPLLPLHILGIFANMTFNGQVAAVLSVFIRVFALVLVLHLLMLVLQFTIAGVLNGVNPLRLMKNMIPAYLTAIGTQSSAATIPITLAQTRKNGVQENIAEFTVPLCATIHLSGSTITLVSCSIAMMMIHGMNFQFAVFFPFIMALGVTMIAAPGVPGGAVMAALGLLASMLGFTEPMIALMIALYMAQDSFGTACNVTGDGAIALIMNKISGHRLEWMPKTKMKEDLITD
ncbi:Proton/glutamate symport protein, Sodium/glutamate symport protein [Clostridiaceae bacterium JG1575]|nr:Proton/glutamate symport protein, Sodium/glutamate symport protein [Clostridiaceae bacterium JG1575]